MAAASPQLRAETPPPRRRASAPEDRAAQQQVWSARQGEESDDWTSSPLPRPKDTFVVKASKHDDLLSPKAAAGLVKDCLVPVKVNGEACFSSPKSGKLGCDLGVDAVVALSPKGTTAQAFLKAPGRLPTVQEHEGQVSHIDSAENGQPAWVVRTPQNPQSPTAEEDMLEDFVLSPAPPGLEDVECCLPKPTVRGTFIQFVSPLKTFSLNSPPKTEPVNFAPAASVASALFGEGHDAEETPWAMSHSPMPWLTHEQIPFFPSPYGPAANASTSQPQEAEVVEAPVAEPRQKGPVVRLAEFLPEPSAVAPPCQPLSVLDQAYYMPTMPTLPMTPMMPGIEASAQFPTGFEGTMPAMMHDTIQGQVQMQDLQPQMMEAPQMQAPQMQFQLPQMPPPQMQAPQLQLPPQSSQLPPPQVQSVTQLQPVTLQPQIQQMPQPSMQAEQMFLQQFMQMQMQPQMQPPTWPPLQPPQPVAGEQLPAPPPQAPLEAPSVLCPSTCHQAGLCHCGEGDGQSTLPLHTAPALGKLDDQQMSAGNGATASNTCILLSAAMFPEMGAGAGVPIGNGHQRF
jgi:hypothetical protein